MEDVAFKKTDIFENEKKTMIDLVPANCPVNGVTTNLMKSLNQFV